MGEVYRARDTKLNRDVALKILPPEFGHDPDRVARFKREAHVLASLNHPNIAAIHGFEDSTDAPALALELVDGPTLAERIAEGPMSLDDVLPIARQIPVCSGNPSTVGSQSRSPSRSPAPRRCRRRGPPPRMSCCST